MKDLRTVPSQVMWHDGMVLCPQHLQQGFSRTEELLQYYQTMAGPFPFGLTAFAYDESLITSGILKVTKLELIFPDGFTYAYDPSVDESLELDLNKYKSELEKIKETLIHVVVPRKLSSNAVVGANTSRFKAVDPEYSFDQITGEDEVLIPRLRPNVQLVFVKEAKMDVVSIPLLHVVYENEFIKLKPFIPPLLRVLNNSKIWEVCLSISSFVREKIQTLIEDVGKLKLISHSNYIFDRYFVLRNLKESILKFEVAVRSEQIHPYYLFLELVDVYSKIISSDFEAVLPPPPEYNHYAILASFEKVKLAIIDFLEREIPTNYKTVRVNKIDDRFEFSFNDSFVFNSNNLILGMKKPSHVNYSDFENWIKSSIISSDLTFRNQQEKRTLGYARSIIDHFNDLIPQRNIFLVYVTLDKSYQKNGNLVVAPSVGSRYNFSPEDVFLYGRKG